MRTPSIEELTKNEVIIDTDYDEEGISLCSEFRLVKGSEAKTPNGSPAGWPDDPKITIIEEITITA